MTRGTTGFGYCRFLVYLLILVLLWQFLSTFQPDNSTPPPVLEKGSLSNEEPVTTEKRKIWSPPPPRASKVTKTPFKYTQIDLGLVPRVSTQERLEREREAAAQAQQEAAEAFSGMNVSGIVGSKLVTAAQAQRFREIVECWTSNANNVWFHDDTPRLLLKHLQEPLFAKCDKRYAKTQNVFDLNKDIPINNDGDWLVPEHAKYFWKPSETCPKLRPIDRMAWCKLLGGRQILIIGDSLNYQVHDLLLDVFRDAPTVCYGELNCREHIICDMPNSRKTKLRYIRNDWLLNNKKMDDVIKGEANMKVALVPWVGGNFLNFYKVMILNRGASYVPDDEFRRELIQSVAFIRRDHPNILIIYRNTPVGHMGCENATAPRDKQFNEDELQALPFHWSESKRQNLIAKEIIEAAGGVYLDVATMTNLRPDGHVGGRDCLQYCIPGVTTEWMRVLYNVFRLLDAGFKEYESDLF